MANPISNLLNNSAVCNGVNSALVNGAQKGIAYGISLGGGSLGAAIFGAVGTIADPFGGEAAGLPGWDFGQTIGNAAGQQFASWAIPTGTKIIPCAKN